MRRRISGLLALALGSVLLGGCAWAMSPVGDGWIYTDVKGPIHATNAPVNEKTLKVGRAKCHNVLGLFAWGDATLETAMKNGDLTRVQHVDHESYTILGCYSEFTTVVYGDNPAAPAPPP